MVEKDRKPTREPSLEELGSEIRRITGTVLGLIDADHSLRTGFMDFEGNDYVMEYIQNGIDLTGGPEWNLVYSLELTKFPNSGNTRRINIISSVGPNGEEKTTIEFSIFKDGDFSYRSFENDRTALEESAKLIKELLDIIPRNQPSQA